MALTPAQAKTMTAIDALIDGAVLAKDALDASDYAGQIKMAQRLARELTDLIEAAPDWIDDKDPAKKASHCPSNNPGCFCLD